MSGRLFRKASLLGTLALAALTSCQRGGEKRIEGSVPLPRLITHGTEVPDSFHPEVVKITKPGTTPGKKKICTATFIRTSPPTLITASHCLPALPTKGDTTGGISFGTKESVGVCVPKGATGHFGPYDMAIVVFDPDSVTAPATAAIGTKAVKGTDVFMIGYGRNTSRKDDDFEEEQEKESGIRRYGRNHIDKIMPSTDERHSGMIFVRGALEDDLESRKEVDQQADSASAKGDSGGPLFAKGTNEIVGVVSGGHGSLAKELTYSYYVNLTGDDQAAFLKKALAPRFLKALAGEDLPGNYEDVCQLSK